MEKFWKNFGKVLLIILIVIVGIFVLAFGGLNLAKFAIYKDYYAVKTDVCYNPGLSDGFVCQGIAAAEENGVILVSGYMADDSASRIYITKTNSECYYVQLKQGEKPFTGHVGGIATTGDTVYVASDDKIWTLSLTEILAAKAGDCVDVGDGVRVNNQASFVYSDENYLYVGEFHDGGKYNVVGHENQTAEGMHYAICSKYALNDLTKPVKVYSIRNKVQGICFMPDGKVVMSTSYGLTDTVYYVYDESKATDSGKTLDGAPLFYLDSLERQMTGPAMGEDLDYYDGQVITMTESASNKYVFGKFFFANKIVKLKF